MLEATAIALAIFPLGLIYASFAEWVIHKRLMHRPILSIQHFYYGHTKVHHAIYRADDTYIVGDRPVRELTLAWWAMPFPVLLQMPVVLAIGAVVSVPAGIGFAAALISYQAVYETFHYCMHVPADRWVERTPWFKWINEHHFQHHRKHTTNLNIILPIFDYVFGTRERPETAIPVPQT